MSSRSLCLPPARTHFWIDAARRYGACSSPVKYGLNGTMPATVNSTVLSTGIVLADGTIVWSRAAQKSYHALRSPSAVRGLVDMKIQRIAGRWTGRRGFGALLDRAKPRPVGELALELDLSLTHRRAPFRDGLLDAIGRSARDLGRRVRRQPPSHSARDDVARADSRRVPQRRPARALEHRATPRYPAR